MDESPEKIALKTLTLCTVKALSKIEKLLNEAPDKKRDKKIQRIIKELEVCNDEAMRIGLQMTAQHIARAKTGRMSLPSAPSVDQQRGSAHRDLMKFHFEHIKGPIADGAAQGAALKFLLDNYSEEVIKKCYEFQTTETWRGKVSWISVRSDIGGWLARNGQNTPTRSLSASERNEQQLIRNIESVGQLRRGGAGGAN
jgi:hypothetical protein